MGKLSKENLKFIASHIEEIEKCNNGTGIYFCFDTKQNGEWAFNILKKSINYSDTLSGIDRRDFRILFPTRTIRDREYDALEDEILGYQVSHIEEVQQTYGNEGLPDDPTDQEDDEQRSKTRDWTTYIIIGAAAVIILLLLWDRKKK